MIERSIPSFFYKNSNSHMLLFNIFYICLWCVLYAIMIRKLCEETEFLSDIILSISMSYISGYIFYIINICREKFYREDFALMRFSALYYCVKKLNAGINKYNSDSYIINFELAKNYCDKLTENIEDLEKECAAFLNFSGLILSVKKEIKKISEKVIANDDSVLKDLRKLLYIVNNRLCLFPDKKEMFNRMNNHLNNNPYSPKKYVFQPIISLTPPPPRL